MKFLANNSDQELDTENNIDLDFNDLEPLHQIQQLEFHFILLLLFLLSSLLQSRSPILSQLAQSAQIQLKRQNQRIAKAIAKLQKSQLREK